MVFLSCNVFARQRAMYALRAETEMTFSTHAHAAIFPVSKAVLLYGPTGAGEPAFLILAGDVFRNEALLL